MGKGWSADYKGYGIVQSASWSTAAPYTAHFSITGEVDDGSTVTFYIGHCPGSFTTDDEAWAAARAGAMEVIDRLAPFTPSLGPALVKTVHGDGALVCEVLPTTDGRFLGRVHFGGVASGPRTDNCPATDATHEEALQRAKALANQLYPTR